MTQKKIELTNRFVHSAISSCIHSGCCSWWRAHATLWTLSLCENAHRGALRVRDYKLSSSCRGTSQIKTLRYPECPSTQYLGFLVPKTIF